MSLQVLDVCINSHLTAQIPSSYWWETEF